MRLAIIHNKAKIITKGYFKERGIEIKTADNWDEFERLYGSLDQFDGLLMHPRISDQKNYLTEIPKKYPTLKLAIGTWDPDASTLKDEELPLFNYVDVDEIYKFFSNESEASPP